MLAMLWTSTLMLPELLPPATNKEQLVRILMVLLACIYSQGMDRFEVCAVK